MTKSIATTPRSSRIRRPPAKPRRGRRVLADYTVAGQQRRLIAVVRAGGIDVLDELRAPLADCPYVRQVEPQLGSWEEVEALALDYICESEFLGEPAVTKKSRW